MENCRITYSKFGCRSFNYLPPNETRWYSECHLLKKLRSEEPNKLISISYPGDHYSLKTDCTGKHQCTSGMCIPKEKKCDGRDDCGDNSDESSCTSGRLNFI